MRTPDHAQPESTRGRFVAFATCVYLRLRRAGFPVLVAMIAAACTGDRSDRDASESALDGADAVDDFAGDRTATDAEADGACRATHFPWGGGDEFMLPGTDCLDCHRVGGSARSVFSVAGTIARGPDCPEPAPPTDIRVIDADGVELVLRSNSVGNFFTDRPLNGPFQFYAEREGRQSRMWQQTVQGSCNYCHHLDARALGYVFFEPTSE